MNTLDLHVHSSFSDGSLTPEELVMLARNTGMTSFALTDHDTTDGIDQALKAAGRTGPEVIPGIEFSTRWLHRDIHILGYFMNYHADTFQQKLHEFLNYRKLRNRQMCERIRRQTGLPISLEELTRHFPDAVITRAHMATWLIEKGCAESTQAAFDHYLGEHAPCFVSKTEVTPADAIQLILTHGGIPVLAHPLLYSLSEEQLIQLISELKDAGLMGIETFYVLNRNTDEAFVRSLAHQYGLIMTGGSDFHGSSKPDIALGTGIEFRLSVPFTCLEQLKAAKSRLQTAQK